MKKNFITITVFLFLSINFSFAQKPHANHTTIYVVDLNKSVDFYRNVMMLDTIAEPFKDGRHIWFQIAPHMQLHVVSGAKEISTHDINIHLAFSVPVLADFLNHLDAVHVNYGNWKQDSKIPQLRPDEVSQVYFQDPDGYWIEVNDDKY